MQMDNVNPRRVVCPENIALVGYMESKRQELTEKPKGISENFEMTLNKAYTNVCNCSIPITTLQQLSHVKGVGKWILKLMKGFFEIDSANCETEEANRKCTANGSEFMRKQELIDSAEASGLSRAPIAPEKGNLKLGQFGNSRKEWYSGWSCMNTLISKGLVVKSSCPAKYMLTQEGQETARQCLVRSDMLDSNDIFTHVARDVNMKEGNESNLELPCGNAAKVAAFTSVGLSRHKDIDIPPESFQRFLHMGYSKEQVICAFDEVYRTSKNKKISSLWPAVLCRLREDVIYGSSLEPYRVREDSPSTSVFTASCSERLNDNIQGDTCNGAHMPNSSDSSAFAPSCFPLRACSTVDYSAHKSSSSSLERNINNLRMPPLQFGERFEDAYEVILVLDDREKFATRGSRSRKIIENIGSQFKIQIQVRRLPVGDGIWIARHKHLDCEYVLDFIVERKKIDDLRCSIRDNRYRDQKLRLMRCGLKKLIYLVEGDPNSSEGAESIKTACFTTEILEGFDVQRTTGLADTLRRYGHLTLAITDYCRSQVPDQRLENSGLCPSFDEFMRRCEDLDKMTVCDVFAIQLMQVPQVTEDVAIAVLDMYPTLLSLARAYSLLDGDVCAQEGMLWKKSNSVISMAASKNILQFVWGS